MDKILKCFQLHKRAQVSNLLKPHMDTLEQVMRKQKHTLVPVHGIFLRKLKVVMRRS